MSPTQACWCANRALVVAGCIAVFAVAGCSRKRAVKGWAQELGDTGSQAVFIFVVEETQDVTIGLVAEDAPIAVEVDPSGTGLATVGGTEVRLPPSSPMLYMWEAQSNRFVLTDVLAQPILDEAMESLRDGTAPPVHVELPLPLLRRLE